MNPHENDEQILAQLVDNDCSPGQVAEIERRLQTEPEFRSLYRRMCDFEASAAFLIRGNGTVVGFPNQSGERSKRVSILAIAAAAAILLVAGHLRFGSRGNLPEPVGLSFSGSATVADGTDLPTSLAPGKTLTLDNGRVDLSFQGGKASATVQAPAKFFFREDGSLDVADGSFGLELKPGSKSLRCYVGNHLIEDIGTTYSFLAEKGTLKEVSVSEGSIRLSSGDGSTAHIVAAGSGLRISSQGYVPFQTDSEQSHEEIFFEWTPATDSGRKAFIPDPGGLIAKTSESLEFSAEKEFSAWLRLPLDSLLRAKAKDIAWRFSATLPTNSVGLLPRHSGISLLKGMGKNFPRQTTRQQRRLGRRHLSGRRQTQRPPHHQSGNLNPWHGLPHPLQPNRIPFFGGSRDGEAWKVLIF